MKIFNFLSTLFRNKDFISQESPILADVENSFLVKNRNIFQEMSIVVDLIEKKANFHFSDKTGGKENITFLRLINFTLSRSVPVSYTHLTLPTKRIV